MSLRLDDLQNGITIYQDPDAFCFGVDAVQLARFAKIRPGERVLDLGCGNGAVIFLMIPDAPKDASFTGLEIQSDAAALAKKNAERNGLSGRVRIVEGDLKEAGRIFPAASFSLITCNPPYYPAGSGKINENRKRAVARHELLCTLADVVRESAGLLTDGGRFCMIHRPERLDEIRSELASRELTLTNLEEVRLHGQAEPTMILIEAEK